MTKPQKRQDHDHEDLRLWSVIAATVRPLPGRAAVKAQPPPAAAVLRYDHAPTLVEAARPKRPVAEAPPGPIEPQRRRKLFRERDRVAAVIDLHNMTQDQARAALTRFIARARADGERAVLVVTGKGLLGDGILRRHVPEWLAAPPLREAVAGLSEAHRRHGGEGALYVALRR